MNDFEMNKLLTKTRDTYGNKNQILVAMEELCELSAALAKFPRYEDEQDAINKTRGSVLDEVADVFIVLNHVTQIFGLTNEDIESRMDKKLERLSRWLDTAESFEQTTKDRTIKEGNT